MTTVSKAELARILGISKPAISQSLRAQRLIQNDESLIDINHPVNKSYLASRGIAVETLDGQEKFVEIDIPEPLKKEPKPSIPAQTVSKKPKPLVKDEIWPAMARKTENKASDSINGTKLEADIARINAQTEHIQTKVAERMKTLISRDIVESLFAAINSAVTDNFLSIGARLLPLISGATRIHDAQVLAEVQEIIDTEVERAISEIKRATTEALK